MHGVLESNCRLFRLLEDVYLDLVSEVYTEYFHSQLQIFMKISLYLDMTPRRFRRSLHRQDSQREILRRQGIPRRVFTFI